MIECFERAIFDTQTMATGRPICLDNSTKAAKKGGTRTAMPKAHLYEWLQWRFDEDVCFCLFSLPQFFPLAWNSLHSADHKKKMAAIL